MRFVLAEVPQCSGCSVVSWGGVSLQDRMTAASVGVVRGRCVQLCLSGVTVSSVRMTMVALGLTMLAGGMTVASVWMALVSVGTTLVVSWDDSAVSWDDSALASVGMAVVSVSTGNRDRKIRSVWCSC